MPECGATKEAAEFRANRRMRDGLSSWCAECHNAASRRWRDRQRDAVRMGLTQASDCKNGAWETYTAPAFKNQGDCVSFVVSKGGAEER